MVRAKIILFCWIIFHHEVHESSCLEHKSKSLFSIIQFSIERAVGHKCSWYSFVYSLSNTQLVVAPTSRTLNIELDGCEFRSHLGIISSIYVICNRSYVCL